MILLQVLVLVNLVGVGGRTVEARYAADSTLELPAADVRELLGVAWPSPWVGVPELARAYPSATFRFLPRAMELAIYDPRLSLPASAAAAAALLRSAQNAPAFAWRRATGAFGAVAADDSGRSQLDLGYTWRGVLTVAGTYLPAARRGAWQAALAPAPWVSLQAAGDRALAFGALRVAAGPAFAFATWQAGAVALDALVALGPVAVFASTRDVFVVTLNRAPLAVQFGRTGQGKTVRLSFGQPASPFFLPAVPPR
jgi:hypothetical protein